MEYLTADAVAPEWKQLDQFVVNELQAVFQLDALSTSHKISHEVFNPQEISEIFDRISYAKGSTIIRMMAHFLTNPIQLGVSGKRNGYVPQETLILPGGVGVHKADLLQTNHIGVGMP